MNGLEEQQKIDYYRNGMGVEVLLSLWWVVDAFSQGEQ